jgi:hypothetical protein
MKATTALLILAAAPGAQAFCPAAMRGGSRGLAMRVTTAPPSSHFEKLKRRYKGPPKRIFDSPEDDESYAAFSDLLSEQQVSFGR